VFKKIFSFFQDQNAEKRNRYRFDVQYRDEIKIFINDKERKLKEISLEGFAYFKMDEEPFKEGDTLNVCFKFQTSELNLKADLKNVSTKFCGCRVISQKNEYSKLIINELSPYLVSFIN
jgi:hypothetical protein